MVQEKFKEVLIIYSDFYPTVSNNLLNSAQKYLEYKKVEYDVKRVDGSLELPIVLSRFKENYSGFIILGCIIKGETDHYHVVKDICLREIYSLASQYSLPLSTALLTVDNIDQAIERSDPNKKDLGTKAAVVCCNLINLLKT
tara:strand:- start:241 stop:666 length:426 start_codon:yes stop_codon:yes gene_type:complete